MFERSFRFLKKISERRVPTYNSKFSTFSDDRPHTDKVGLFEVFGKILWEIRIYLCGESLSVRVGHWGHKEVKTSVGMRQKLGNHDTVALLLVSLTIVKREKEK